MCAKCLPSSRDRVINEGHPKVYFVLVKCCWGRVPNHQGTYTTPVQALWFDICGFHFPACAGSAWASRHDLNCKSGYMKKWTLKGLQSSIFCTKISHFEPYIECGEIMVHFWVNLLSFQLLRAMFFYKGCQVGQSNPKHNSRSRHSGI